MRIFLQLDRTIKNVQAGEAAATSATLALGISGTQLADLPTFINALADAWQRIPDSAAKAERFRELVGGVRGVRVLAPLFEGGAAGLKEREETAVKSGSAPDQETLEALKETAEEINKLKDALTGLGVKIFQEFKGPIDLSIGTLQSFVDGAKSGTQSIHELVGELDKLGGAAIGAGAGFLLGGPLGALAGGAIGGVAGVSGIVSAVERIKTDLGTIADAWGSLDEWIRAHSGLGVHLLPEFVDPAAPVPRPGAAAGAHPAGRRVRRARATRRAAATRAAGGERQAWPERGTGGQGAGTGARRRRHRARQEEPRPGAQEPSTRSARRAKSSSNTRSPAPNTTRRRSTSSSSKSSTSRSRRSPSGRRPSRRFTTN